MIMLIPMQKAENRAQEIKKELTDNPADFERLAKQHSDDKASANKGVASSFL